MSDMELDAPDDISSATEVALLRNISHNLRLCKPGARFDQIEVDLLSYLSSTGIPVSRRDSPTVILDKIATRISNIEASAATPPASPKRMGMAKSSAYTLASPSRRQALPAGEASSSSSASTSHQRLDPGNHTSASSTASMSDRVLHSGGALAPLAHASNSVRGRFTSRATSRPCDRAVIGSQADTAMGVMEQLNHASHQSSVPHSALGVASSSRTQGPSDSAAEGSRVASSSRDADQQASLTRQPHINESEKELDTSKGQARKMLRCPCCTKDHPIPIQGAHHVYLKCLKAHRRAFCIACESVVTETDLPAHQVTCLDEWIDALLESGPLTGAVTVQYPPSIGRKMMHYCPCSACLEKVLGQTPQHKKTRLRTAGKGLPIYKYLPDSESHIASHVREAAKSTKPACPIYGCGDDVRDEVQLLSHLAVEHSISALVDDQLSRIRPQNIKAALKGISSLKVFSATGRNAKVCIKPHGGVYDEWRKKRKTATQTNTDAREGDE